MIIFNNKKIPEVNIGIFGHVDHGKTTLTQALTGKWTDTHSEELKRGITIRLGYADATFFFCSKCKLYSTSNKCISCMSDCKPVRTVSFIDAPGHETLMATVLSGASLIDGAILIIAANEKCPQLQTAEHLKALDITGIKNIVIAQNKIDVVTKEQAIKNYKEIKKFVKHTIAENAPIIPISAIHIVNIDMLIQAIEEHIKTPERDKKKTPRFYIARSFDINKPGTDIEKLHGGVIGGSLVSGKLHKDEIIEIRPGPVVKGKIITLKTKITEIIKAGKSLDETEPGGLIALKTELDPSIVKADNLSGNILGHEGQLPPILDKLKVSTELFEYVIGIEGQQKVEPLQPGDALMITAATAKTLGIVTSVHKNVAEIELKLPICIETGNKIAISKQVSERWHLIGCGTIL